MRKNYQKRCNTTSNITSYDGQNDKMYHKDFGKKFKEKEISHVNVKD